MDANAAADAEQATAYNRPEDIVRFASLTDCDAEQTGLYFKKTGRSNGSTVDDGGGTLFVNAQHRGGDTLDKAIAITRAEKGGSSSP